MSDVVHTAFTEEQASRLSGVTQNQLKYWDKTGFFKPSFAAENRKVKFSRVYTFKDIVGLRTLNMLINEYSISTRYLREVRDELKRPQEIWADTTLYVLGKKVHLEEPELSTFREPTSGQLTLTHLPLRKVISEVQLAVKGLMKRDQASVGKTNFNRNIARNSEVIRGKRIPVSTIAGYLADGFSPKEIIAEFPSLTLEDITEVSETAGKDVA